MKVPFPVMCIKTVNYDMLSKSPMPAFITIGSEYVVVFAKEEDGRLWYALEGFELGWGFDARLFATLPEATADEMAEAERESIVNLETV